VEYETEEQQVEALKAWWAENGKAVIAGVVLGGGVIGGWSLWKGHQEKQAIAASDAFSRSMEAIADGDTDAVQALAKEITDDQPKTLYATYTSLAAARAAVEKGDLEEAAKQLEWVIDNTQQSDVKTIASVRLARVIAANGDAAAGLAALPGTYPESFAGLVEEARGDLHVLAGDAAAARSAYKKAQESENIPNPEALTMKLNELAEAADAS